MPEVGFFEKYFYDNTTPEWSLQYLDYRGLYEALMCATRNRKLRETCDDEEATEATGLFEDVDSFEDSLREEMKKVRAFFDFKLEQFTTQIALLEEYARSEDAEAKKLHKFATELYRGLLMLLNYSNLNWAAEAELKRVQDEKLGSSLRRKKSARTIWKAAFTGLRSGCAELLNEQQQNSVEIKKHQQILIGLIAEKFYEGNLVAARTELAKRRRLPKPTRKTDITLGIYIGICLPLIVLAVFYTFLPTSPEFDTPEMNAKLFQILPIYRYTLVFIAAIWLWGVVSHVFTVGRVNFMFILELSPSTMLEPTKVFELAAGLSALWLSCFVCWIAVMRQGQDLLGVRIPAIIFPMILSLSTFLLFAWPRNEFFGPTRFWLWSQIFTVMFLAPFRPVTFASNLIGDYLTSMVKGLGDIEYTVCLYVTGELWNATTLPSDVCSWQASVFGRPVLTVLPSIFRILQCCRRMYDDKKTGDHIWNALKYSLSVVAVVLQSTHEYAQYGGEWGVGRFIWLLILVCATLYAFAWDIIKDWGYVKVAPLEDLEEEETTLTALKNKSTSTNTRPFTQLQPVRSYMCPALWSICGKKVYLRSTTLAGEHRDTIYLPFVLLNLFGRSAWAYTLLTPSPQESYQHVLAFVTAFIEILRRSGWLILRLLNEHFNNCGKFRACSEIPLDFYQYEKPQDCPCPTSPTPIAPTPLPVTPRSVHTPATGGLQKKASFADVVTQASEDPRRLFKVSKQLAAWSRAMSITSQSTGRRLSLTSSNFGSVSSLSPTTDTSPTTGISENDDPTSSPSTHGEARVRKARFSDF